VDNAALEKKRLRVARFFLPTENVKDRTATITGQELDHLRRVLRLRSGDRVTLFDDQGWEHDGVISSLGPDHGLIEILKSYQPGRESFLDITLAQSLGKGDKMDLIVEKATELGVGTIIPFFSSRTVPRPDTEKMGRRQARWEKIALNATKQSGRTRIPEILEFSDFETLVCGAWHCDLKLLLWEKESVCGLAEIRGERPELKSVLLAIGPEGGFSSEEAAKAKEHGFRSIRLGKRILRTETAALAALSLVQFLWGDLG